MRLKTSEKRWVGSFYNSFVAYLGKTKLSWKKIRHSDRYWTKIIMEDVLGRAAINRYGLKPYSKFHSKKGWERPEYMVDMCWAREKRGEYYIDTAIEEEWNDTYKDKEDLLWDFYKIVDVKAYLKVFIFAPKRRSLEWWMDEFTRIIKKHTIRLNEEVYLILSLAGAENDLTKVTAYIIDKFGESRYYKTTIC